MTVNRWSAYYSSQHMEQFFAETGLSNQRARGWMRNNDLPYLQYEWYVKAPKWERLVIRDFIADMIYLCDKVGRTPDADGISNAMSIWREKRGIA